MEGVDRARPHGISAFPGVDAACGASCVSSAVVELDVHACAGRQLPLDSVYLTAVNHGSGGVGAWMKRQRHGRAKILIQEEIQRLFAQGLQTTRDRTLFAVALFSSA